MGTNVSTLERKERDGEKKMQQIKCNLENVQPQQDNEEKVFLCTESRNCDQLKLSQHLHYTERKVQNENAPFQKNHEQLSITENRQHFLEGSQCSSENESGEQHGGDHIPDIEGDRVLKDESSSLSESLLAERSRKHRYVLVNSLKFLPYSDNLAQPIQKHQNVTPVSRASTQDSSSCLSQDCRKVPPLFLTQPPSVTPQASSMSSTKPVQSESPLGANDSSLPILEFRSANSVHALRFSTPPPNIQEALLPKFKPIKRKAPSRHSVQSNPKRPLCNKLPPFDKSPPDLPNQPEPSPQEDCPMVEENPVGGSTSTPEPVYPSFDPGVTLDDELNLDDLINCSLASGEEFCSYFSWRDPVKETRIVTNVSFNIHEVKPKPSSIDSDKAEIACHFLDFLNQDRKSGLYTDVVVQVQGQDFKLHKKLLVSVSNNFQALFDPRILDGYSLRLAWMVNIFRRCFETFLFVNNNIQFQGKDCQMVVMDFLGIVQNTPKLFTYIIDFIYTGRLPLTNENVQEILMAADYLGIKLIKDKCEEFMLPKVSPRNIFDAFEMSNIYNLTRLENVARNSLMRCLLRVYRHQQFLRVRPETLKALFEDDNLIIFETTGHAPLRSRTRELKLFEVVLHYLGKKYADNDNVTRMLLRTVRLLDIPGWYMNHKLKSWPQLQVSNTVNILIQLGQILANPEILNSNESFEDEVMFEPIPDSWRRRRLLAYRTIKVGLTSYGSKITSAEPSPIAVNFGNKIGTLDIHLRLKGTHTVVVGGVGVHYHRLTDNSNTLSIWTGTDAPIAATHSLELAHNEYITKVIVGSDCAYIYRLTFVTSMDRTFGPFGGNGGIDHVDTPSGFTLPTLYAIQSNVDYSLIDPILTNMRLKWVCFD